MFAHVPWFDLIWKTTKFPSDKAAEKSRSTDEIKEKTENAIPAATKKPQTLVLNYLMVLRRNYKLHSSLRRADYLTTTTELTLKIFRMVQVLAGVSFQNHWQIFCLFEELLHLLTLSHVHNGPQVNPTTSGFPLDSNNHELHTTAPIRRRSTYPATNSTVTARESENSTCRE